MISWATWSADGQIQNGKQRELWKNNKLPTVNISAKPSNAVVRGGMELAEVNGLFDIGISSKTYYAIRPLLHKEIQAVFSGSKTPEQAIASYAAGINATLK